MSNFVLKLVLKYLGGAQIKKLLDLLPLNGKKAIISGALTAVFVLSIAFENGIFGQLLDIMEKVLSDSGAVTLLPASDIGALVSAFMVLLGLLHKALKKAEELARYRGL
jgi:hypothetical protein